MSVTPRPYQVEILEASKVRNVIAVLPTGSGKTLIAALLVKHRCDSYDLSTNHAFSAAFLAPTKVLVHQQAAYLKQFIIDNNMRLKVSVYTGENFNSRGLHIDRWMGSDWRDQLHTDCVMVMTPAILQDILQRSLLPLATFDCIVIDEIHHAQKNSPVAVVCKFIKEYSGQHSICVLGLTASPVTGKALTLDAIRKLEEATNCKVVVASNASEDLQAFTDRHTNFFTRYSPSVPLEDLEIILKDESLLIQERYNSLEHGMSVIQHASMRLRHAVGLCEIYRTLRTLNKQPSDFEALASLSLQDSVSQADHLQQNRTPHTPLAAYELISVRTFNALKQLNSFVRQFAIITVEAGVLVTVQALVMALPAFTHGGIEAVPGCGNRSGHDKDSSETSVDMDTLQRRGEMVQASPFPLSMLYQTELCMCSSLIDVLVALGSMLGPVACGIVAEELMRDNPALDDYTTSFMKDIAHLLREISIHPANVNMAHGGYGFLPPSAIDRVNLQTCSKWIIRASQLLLQAFPRQDIDCIPVPLSVVLSDKVMKTLTVLCTPLQQDATQPLGEGPVDLTIVFCNMRVMAASLAALFAARSTVLSSLLPETPMSRHRKVDSLVGGSWGRKQNVVIENMRTGEINCLFATSVLEEGLDLPNCQIIVNFDLPSSMSSFLQRRGRGRKSSTQIISLIPDNTTGDLLVRQFEQFGVTEIKVASLVASRSSAAFGSHSCSLLGALGANSQHDDPIPMLCDFNDDVKGTYTYKIESSGAVVDITNSVRILFQYCGSLNIRKDFYYVAKPIFWMARCEVAADSSHNSSSSSTPKEVYQCFILLPAPTPNRLRCHSGPPCQSKRVAKAVTCFLCVRELHKAQEIDDWLYPGSLGMYLLAFNPLKSLSTSTSTSTSTSIPAGSTNPGSLSDVALSLNRSEAHRLRQVLLGSDSFLNGLILTWIKTVPDVCCLRTLPVHIVPATTKLHVYVVVVSGYETEVDQSRQSLGDELHIAGLRDTSFAFLNPLPDELLCQSFEFRVRGRESFRIRLLPRADSPLDVTTADLMNLQRFHRAILGFENELISVLGFDSIEDHNVRESENVAGGNGNTLPWLNLQSYTALHSSYASEHPVSPAEWSRSSKGMFYILVPPLPTSPHTLGNSSTPKYWEACAEEAQLLTYNMTAKYLLKKWDSCMDVSSGFYDMTDQRSVIDCSELKGCLIARPSDRLAVVLNASPCCDDSGSIELTILPVHSEITMISFMLASEKDERAKRVKQYMKHDCPIFTIRIEAGKVLTKFKVLGKARWLFLGLAVPSAIWRIQSYLLAMELRSHLRLFSTQQPQFIVPDTQLLLKTMTLRMCNEVIDNERLELIGDSLLKLVISVELYKMHPKKGEGYLTAARSNIISNLNLFKVCVDSELFRFMRAQSVLSREIDLRFTPPGMPVDAGTGKASFERSLRGRQLVGSLNPSSNADCLEQYSPLKDCLGQSNSPNEHVVENEITPVDVQQQFSLGLAHSSISQFTKIWVKQKTLSDFIEALLGATYVYSGEIESAIALIKALGAWPQQCAAENSDDLTAFHNATKVDEQVLTVEEDEEIVIPDDYPKELAELALCTNAQHLQSLNISNVQPTDNVSLAVTSDPFGHLRGLEVLLGYEFQHKPLLLQAMTHCSVQHAPNNQRLEYLGDAVLDFVVVENLFHLHPYASPGDLSTQKSAIVNNEQLGKVAVVQLSLYKYLRAGDSNPLLSDLREVDDCVRNGLQCGKRSDALMTDINTRSATTGRPLTAAAKALADALEASIGAVYLDSGGSLAVIHSVVARLNMMSL